MRPAYGWRRWVPAAAALVVALVVAAVLSLGACSAPPPQTVTVVAVGDMACDPTDPSFGDGAGANDECRHQAVSDRALALGPDALLGLGDYQYEIPTSDAYDSVYGSSWGRLREVTIPALGNQEYKVHEANTFYEYFGDRVGSATGYWVDAVGSWRVLVLNSNCTVVVGGCAEGSPQEIWLRQQLASDETPCTLAMWHHPRWSTGIIGHDDRTAALFAALDEHGVEMVLSGHEAHYERFAPLSDDGRQDEGGVQQFVVGTGGQAVYEPEEGEAAWRVRDDGPGSEARDTQHHGLLELTLRPDSYSWRFVTAAGDVGDAGSRSCA